MFFSPATADRHRPKSDAFPNVGRFLEADPLGYEDSPNLYAYVGNDPVNWVDPLGLAGLPTMEECKAQPDKPVCGVVKGVLVTGNLGSLLRGGGGGGGGGGGDGGEGSDREEGPVEKISRKIVCAITTFSGSADFAAGFGPVLKGSVGVDWNQKTGQVSLVTSYSVGYGVAASVGLGGSMSNTERTAGYSKSTNIALAFLGGLSGNWSSPNSVSGSLSAGKFGFEASRTENKTSVTKLYVADKGAKCPGGK